MTARFTLFIILELLLACLRPVNLWSQTTIQPEYLTIEDGLAQGYIGAMCQDREGFLWIGTKNGLNRYDGERFELFTNNPDDPYSISHNWVTCLTEIGDYLLIGTMAGGLNIFYKPNQRFYKIAVTNSKWSTIPSLHIGYIHQDSLGQIWVADPSQWELYRLRFPDNFFERPPPSEELLPGVDIFKFPVNGVSNIFKSDRQYIYGMQAPRKLLKIDIRTGTWEAASIQPPLDTTTMRIDYFGGNPMLHSPKEIVYLEQGEWKKIRTTFHMVRVFYFADDKQLWIPTEKELLLYDNWTPDGKSLERANATAVISDLKINVKELIKDQSGIIWGGTGGLGAFKISPRLFKIKNLFEGHSIYAPPFATRHGEIILDNPAGELLHHFTSVPQLDQGHPILFDLSGSQWFEQNDGNFLATGQSKSGEQIFIFQISGRWSISATSFFCDRK